MKIHPWSQRKGETNRAYAAFLMFRDQVPEERTKAEAIRIYSDRYETTMSATKKRLHAWAKRWEWDDRVVAYDSYMDAAEVEAFRRRRIAAAKRHADQAIEVQLAMMEPIRLYNERLLSIVGKERANQLDELDDADLLRLGKETAKVLKDFQGAEREALSEAMNRGSDPGENTVDTIRVETLRGLLGSPDAIAMVERMQFQVSGNGMIPAGEPGNGSGGEPADGDDPGEPGTLLRKNLIPAGEDGGEGDRDVGDRGEGTGDA